MHDDGRYDFIIIGAGSAGCVLANRLSASGATVLLLEAGGPDVHPLIRIPALAPALHDTAMDWGFRSTAQAHLGRRRIALPRGRVLGGSSSINYMIYMRGNRGDYDHWAQLGNAGWTYDEVLPFFRKAENNTRLHDDYHGNDGPLVVSDVVERHLLAKLFVEAAIAAGLVFNDDVNGASQEGVGYFQATIGARGRCSTAVAYLAPALARPNLKLVTRAHVTRVRVEGGHAAAVDYLTRAGYHSAGAGEIILAAGAIGSPHILLLSGIGPADELSAAGVEVVRHLPGVGKNLQDHLSVRVRYEIREPLTLFGLPAETAKAAQKEFLDSGTGVFASNYLEAGAFFSCDPRSEYPDHQLFFVPSFGHEVADGYAADRHGFSFVAYVNRPRSRGEVRLASDSPLDRPLIDPNYLSASEDLDLAVESLRFMRRIGDAAPLAAVGPREIYPGRDTETSEALVTYIRRSANTTWHQVGTCKMGVDEAAVVDPSLKVHGVEGLRVVDASIMPTIVSGNTNAPTIMIAEKAASLILG